MATTSAERQAKYRKACRDRGENGERRINMWVSTGALLALRRLAKRNGVSRRQMLERLIVEVDEQILNRLDMSLEEWNEYMDVTAYQVVTQ